MNTTKIAALYADPIFNTLLRWPSFDPSTTLTEQVKAHGMYESRVVSADGRRYHVEASQLHGRSKYRNDLGYSAGGFLDEKCTKRQAEWVLRQLPGGFDVPVDHLRKELAKADTFLVNVWGYGAKGDTLSCLRFGAREDFEGLLRGIASIRTKRRKQARKLEAQLRAYHGQQVAAAQAEETRLLQRGHWLGEEKALTTAARTSDPTVAFLGDARLSDEQRRALGLRYWVVPEGQGMSAAFPTGTGIALKVVTSSKQLVDGAVYLSQVTFGKPGDDHYCPVLRLGRLDKSRKTYGAIPLFWDDEPGKNLHIGAEWKPAAPGQGYEVQLMQVVYYTTRAAESAALPAPMVAETQPARPQPVKRQRRRALAHAA